MITHDRFLRAALFAVLSPIIRRARPWTALLFVLALGNPATSQEPLKIAAIVTVYTPNSHADVIVSRLLQGYSLDEKGEYPRLKLVSLYTDQVPEADMSRGFASSYGFSIHDTVAGALTLGSGKLAVDGVLLICEHGNYPESPTGSIQHPKRRLFGEVAQVIERAGRPVPVFSDKHLSDNWPDAKWIYDTARRLNIPMMAGSSLPTLWRYPPQDTARGKPIRELVVTSYHRLDAYGFHALELAQCLVERRAGGETGIAAAQCITGDAVWRGVEQGIFDRRLLQAALGRLKRQLPADKSIEELVPAPDMFVLDYRDGLRVRILTLNYAVGEWAAAWRYDDDSVESTLFWTQEARPFMHFTYLVKGIDQMFHSGQPTWPVERTLLTTGALDALLTSKSQGGLRRETPELNISYQSSWNWHQPPPP